VCAWQCRLLSGSTALELTASLSFVLNRHIHPPLGDIKVHLIGIEARLLILGLTALRDNVDK
jgi:hypothetical protein